MVTNVRRLMYAMAVLCIALSSGCATIQHGGAPIPPFDLEKDIKDLTDTFGTKASITKYYEAGRDKREARNEFIDGRLALYNIRYLQFIRNLGVDKQHLDAATEVLLMGIGVAGTLVGGSQAKTNLAALATLITGAKITVDKHFYFEKTVPALVATMNAQRKAVLLRIMEGGKLDVNAYPFTQALSDLYDYEQAGTLVGAINTIQADAGVKEAGLDVKIRTLLPATEVEIMGIRAVNPRIAALIKDPTKLPEINRVLKDVGAPKFDFDIFKAAADALWSEFQKADPADVQKWRSALGM